MKNIVFDTYSELVENLIQTINKEQNVSILCDHELAFELLQNVDVDDYEDSVDELDEDIDEYYFSKYKNIYCGVEKARCEKGQHEGKLKFNEADHIILFNPAIESFDEVMDAENPLIDIEVVDYDEYDLEEKEDTGDIETDIITTGVCRCNEFNSDCDGCDECDECESQDFGHVITDRINLVMEMFNDSDVCDDCKFEALVDLVLLGVDGALQGCIGRKEDKIEYQIRVLLGERTKHF